MPRVLDMKIEIPIMATSFSGNSSVGRAQPCQGWGREFESRFPLQTTKAPILRGFLFSTSLFGWIAKWLCSGLQSRGRRFDSGSSLHHYIFFKNPQNRVLAA